MRGWGEEYEVSISSAPPTRRHISYPVYQAAMGAMYCDHNDLPQAPIENTKALVLILGVLYQFWEAVSHAPESSRALVQSMGGVYRNFTWKNELSRVNAYPRGCEP